MNCLIMEDPIRNLSLQAFSQPLMIPAKAVQRLHDNTPVSYPSKESGFAITIGQAISEEFNVFCFKQNQSDVNMMLISY